MTEGRNDQVPKWMYAVGKRFPLHLNTVSTLPCETWNAHCARATKVLPVKVTLKFIAPQLWPPNSPDLNEVDYSVTDLDLLTSWRRQRRMSAAMTTWSSWAHSILSRCFSSSRSVMSTLNTFFEVSFAIFPTLCNQLYSNLLNLEATVKVE